jgi:hypothetical protein
MKKIILVATEMDSFSLLHLNLITILHQKIFSFNETQLSVNPEEIRRRAGLSGAVKCFAQKKVVRFSATRIPRFTAQRNSPPRITAP